MDKKNTMLLTVIAVATLLVAVVGATFAYFAISTNANNANTTITGITENVITAPIALVGSTALKLDLTAEDMSKENQNYYYYAGESTRVKGKDAEEGEKASDHKVTVGTATIGHDGSQGVKYQCTANYTIKYSTTDLVPATFVADDDAVLMLYDSDNVVVTKEKDFATITTTGVDLATLAADEDGLTGDVVFTLTSSEADVTENFQASLRIKNTVAEQQDNLAGKNFTITFTANSFTCDTVA